MKKLLAVLVAGLFAAGAFAQAPAPAPAPAAPAPMAAPAAAPAPVAKAKTTKAAKKTTATAKLAKRLEALHLGGVSFEPTQVRPKSSVHANKPCRGVRVRVNDASHFEPVRTAIAIASVLRELHEDDWDFDAMDRMLRHPAAMDAIERRMGSLSFILLAVRFTRLDFPLRSGPKM